MVFGAIVLTAVLSLNTAVSESTAALEKSAREKLTIENTQVKEAVEGYFDTIESQIRVKSSDPMYVEAAKAFIPAFNQYQSQRSALSGGERAALQSY